MDIIVICLILGMYKCTVGLKAQPTSAPSPEGKNKLKLLNNLLQKSNFWRENNFIYIRLDLKR